MRLSIFKRKIYVQSLYEHLYVEQMHVNLSLTNTIRGNEERHVFSNLWKINVYPQSKDH